MPVANSLIALAAVLATAIGQPDIQCGGNPYGWRTKVPVTKHKIPVTRVKFYRNASLTWNGRLVSDVDLAEYAERAASMRPRPWIVVSVEPGAPCEQVLAIKRAIDAQANCSQTRACVDGGAF
jgi:hypothetical protein